MRRAYDVGADASTVGFDWIDPLDALKKVREEVAEIEDAIRNQSTEKQAEELGDLLFAVINVARLIDVDPDAALQDAVDKFNHRFSYVRERIDSAKETPDLETMEAWWQDAKRRE